MFEPGWNLIDFIERPEDPKQFDPARLRPIPIFYGTPNFSIIIVEKLFPNSNLHGGYIYVWAGLKPDWFHWQSSRRTQNKFDPARLRPIPIFYGTPNFPIIIVETLNFFLQFKPPWRLHLCLSRAETWLISLTSVQGTQINSIQPGSDPFPFSMERQTSLKSLLIHHILLHFKPPWRLHLCLSRAETWLISLTSVQGTQNNSIQPGSDPFPFSMERQTSQ